MTDFPKAVVIIGAGDNGREIAEIIKRIELSDRSLKLIGFLDDDVELQGKEFNGVKVLGNIDSFVMKPVHFVCSIADPSIRKRVVERLLNLGYKPINIIDPSVIIYSGVKMGVGIVINGLCGIMANVVIEDYVHINLLSCIGHDSQ